MSDGYMSGGEYIRQLRKARGLTQIELAERAGISVNSLRLYEAEKRNPKINHFHAILEALGEGGTITDYGLHLMNRQKKIDTILTKIATTLKIDPTELDKDLEAELVRLGVELTQDAPSFNKEKLLLAFSKLNDEGQSKAVERVEELTEIPKYQKEKTPQD